MAMNGTVMGDAIVAALELVQPGMTAAQITQLNSAWEAIGIAIVNHIATHAVVAVTAVSGVTTGGSVSGPGSGTIS